MFIVACFSKETRNTTATSEEVTTLAKSSRRDESVTKETMPAVTATENQNRTAIGSVQNNKMKAAPSSESALVTATTRRVPASGMATASVSAPVLPCRRPRVILLSQRAERGTLSSMGFGNLGEGGIRSARIRLLVQLAFEF